MPTARRPVDPFRTSGVATDNAFTHRADEVARIMRTLEEPGAELLVEEGRTYHFDSPFPRGRVILNALPDIGMRPDPIALLGTAERRARPAPPKRWRRDGLN